MARGMTAPLVGKDLTEPLDGKGFHNTPSYPSGSHTKDCKEGFHNTPRLSRVMTTPLVKKGFHRTSFKEGFHRYHLTLPTDMIPPLVGKGTPRLSKEVITPL